MPLTNRRQDIIAQQDGILVQLYRQGEFVLPNYIWARDPPTRLREMILYTESATNQSLSIEIAFLSQIKFDPSTHFKVAIYFEGDCVWAENVTSQQICAQWKKSIFKPNRGKGRGPGAQFFFNPVVPPSNLSVEGLEHHTKTDQGTISVRFYRLKVLNSFEAQRAYTAHGPNTETIYTTPKVWSKDPTKRLSDRPGIRYQRDKTTYKAAKAKKHEYRQEDENINPYYVFDFKIRSRELLKELKILRPTLDETRRRQQEGVQRFHREFTRLQPLKTEDGDDEVIFLGGIWNGVGVGVDAEANAPPAPAPSNRRVDNTVSRIRDELRARQSSTLGGGAEDNPLFVSDNDDDDDDDDDIKIIKEEHRDPTVPDSAYAEALSGLTSLRDEMQEMNEDEYITQFSAFNARKTNEAHDALSPNEPPGQLPDAQTRKRKLPGDPSPRLKRRDIARRRGTSR